MTCSTEPNIPAAVRPHQRISPRDGRETFRRYAVAVAIAGEWIPWAEFVDRAWRDLTNRAEVEDSLGAWRKAREATLTELAMLGLTATVERTDRSIALGGHEADLAGLVRLHLPLAEPPNPCGWLDATRTAYAERMHHNHGLTRCEGLPRSLRCFCGQTEPAMRRRWPGDRVVGPLGELLGGTEPPWMDHTQAWLDVEGLPVLTTEPYQLDNPLAVTRELNDLPLHVEVHPGLWNDHTTLIILRWNCDETPLPAEAKTLVERTNPKSLERSRVYV